MSDNATLMHHADLAVARITACGKDAHANKLRFTALVDYTVTCEDCRKVLVENLVTKFKAGRAQPKEEHNPWPNIGDERYIVIRERRSTEEHELIAVEMDVVAAQQIIDGEAQWARKGDHYLIYEARCVEMRFPQKKEAT